MSDFRIKGGLAFGDYGNFSYRSTGTAGLLTSDDTTPDVTGGTLFYTNNTGNTAISYFDGRMPGGVLGSEEGKVIHILHLDTATTYTHSSVLRVGSGTYNPPQYSTISFLHANSVWYGLGRNDNFETGSHAYYEVLKAGSAAIPAHGASFVILKGSTSTIDFGGVTGGEPGQTVIVYNGGSGVMTVTNSAGAAGATSLYIPGTSTFTVAVTAAIMLVCVTGGANAKWALVSGFSTVP